MGTIIITTVKYCITDIYVAVNAFVPHMQEDIMYFLEGNMHYCTKFNGEFTCAVPEQTHPNRRKAP